MKEFLTAVTLLATVNLGDSFTSKCLVASGNSRNFTFIGHDKVVKKYFFVI